ncbi:MAG: phage holin family protein [Bacteroidales bacterium]|nr:phage holin family protein [Bacteroidales bacterium]
MAKKDKKQKGYKWVFSSVGGTVRVKISSGQDIAHLGELDRKLWTVLSCPVTGLEFDPKTLAMIDGNADGKIRVDEVISSAKWLTDAVSDPDMILKGESSFPLSAFSESETGKSLKASAAQILANLKLEKDEISIEDTADNEKIFAETKFNGDGIITPASADDERLKALITEAAASVGSSHDRSGAEGVNTDQIEAFYAACADYAAWKDAGTPDIFPFGDDTEAALAACEAVKAKVADFFMRCKLIRFDADAAGAVDVSVEKIGAISGGDLSANEEIATYPLARPNAEGTLSLVEGLNPAWQGAIASLKALVFPKKDRISEAEWTEALGKFAAYTAWKDAKKGAEVEGLGLDEVKAVLKEDRKAELLDLVAQDKALEAEALAIEAVDKFLHLYRDFFRFLNNYVVLSDFYDKDQKAIFQAGRLYIDQRSTDLCVKVAGPSPEISSLSGMYILYCACTSEKLGKSFNIAAVITDGDVDDLRVGKNAVFYDRDGNDYTAKVVAIVENPISVRQAFWTPYKKVARLINDKIDKNAAEKNEKSMAGFTSVADNATDGKTPAAPFDIAKFAGIFAAISMGVGLVGAALAGIAASLKTISWWQFLLIIAVIMLLISGPSMFIAWRKLRKRDVGPLLNANGWAINSKALVNIAFGATLTQLAKLPKLTAVDPKERKKRRRRRFIIWTVIILLLAGTGAALYFTNHLKCIGLPYKDEPVEEVVEAPEAAEVAEPAEAAEAPAETPAEAPAAE